MVGQLDGWAHYRARTAPQSTGLSAFSIHHVFVTVPLNRVPFCGSHQIIPGHTKSLLITPNHSWTCQITPGHAKSLLVTSNHSWSHLVTPGHTFDWHYSPQCRILHLITLTWSHMVTPAHTWSHMVTHGHTWSHMVKHGQTWSHVVTPAHTWSHLLTPAHTWSHMDV